MARKSAHARKVSAGMKLAWAAGFLDGEGCFTAGVERARVTPILTAVQTERASLEALQELFGGRIHPARREIGKPAWQWHVKGATALRKILPQLLPHLVVKKEQAEVLLNLCETFVAANNKPISAELAATRMAYVENLRVLKKAA